MTQLPKTRVANIIFVNSPNEPPGNRVEVTLQTAHDILKLYGHPHNPLTYRVDIIIECLVKFWDIKSPLYYERFDEDRAIFIFKCDEFLKVSRWFRFKQFLKGE